ncbi:MAG: Glu/Leu/Phe/Val dehydrogenase [Maricaulaceae bacterium]|jgi:glutamate dehydrogenase
MAYNFFDASRQILKEAGEVGEIDPHVMELLAGPARIVAFRIPLKMDDGGFRVFDAYRVRYNDAIGPTRDGTRICPDLDLDEVKALALIMSVKHAAGGIPAGGGKGGVAADPRALSRREFEALCRGYVRGLRPMGSAYDVPGADIGTDLQTMAWMLDEYETLNGRHEPAAVNDKPPILGGTLGGYEATGRGVFETFEETANETGFEIPDAAVAIQGFGQVGAVAAAMFQEAGCRVVAVSDSRGGVYAKEGLDVAGLLEHKRATGGVAGFSGAKALANAELLTCECDVLIPAAVQGVITTENAGEIRARMVVEGANAPTTPAAEAVLLENGITVVPDVLANAGSVHLCQMERTQGLYDNYWDIETINRLRRERLVAGIRAALNTAAKHKVTVRLGAWINALKRIEEAVKMRGWC